MIEIKVTNGQEIRNYDDAHFTLFVVELARMMKDNELDEVRLCRWLGSDSNDAKMNPDDCSEKIRKIQKSLFFDMDTVISKLEKRATRMRLSGYTQAATQITKVIDTIRKGSIYG